jgi:hypothetical protein
MKAFKDGEFDSVLDKGKILIYIQLFKTNLVADKLISAYNMLFSICQFCMVEKSRWGIVC